MDEKGATMGASSIHPHWVHWWVLLLHSGHQMWLFFDDEDLEFPGRDWFNDVNDDESKEILAAPIILRSPSRFPNLQNPKKKDKTKPQIGT